MGLGNLIGLGRSDSGLNPQLRKSKAKRILALVSTFRAGNPLRVLDFGTGTGLVASAMQAHLGADSTVTGADIQDVRVDKSLPYLEVTGTQLPAADQAYNLVVSNHVLEHVGDASDQHAYLLECRRVLATDGLLYLAIPNRWTLMEPHFRTPFLSWPAEQFRNRYLSLLLRCGMPVNISGNAKRRRDSDYDIRLLSRRQVRKLLLNTGFIPTDVTREAINLILVQQFGFKASIAKIGALVLGFLIYPLVPTLCFVASPAPLK